MDGGIDSVGEAVTGGILARAVEPMAGETGGHGATCLNCGTGLVGSYCHNCGQKGHVRRTLRAFGHDIAHSVVHFDGKVWRTLPLLAWRPGELTRRYIAGERARFVSPMALFLFSVFLMFAVFNLVGGPINLQSDTPAEERIEAVQELRQAQDEAREEIRGLEVELRQARVAGEPTTGIESELKGVRQKLAFEQRAYQLAVRLANEEEARDAGQLVSGSPGGGAAAADEPKMNIMSKIGWKPLDDAIERAERNPSLLLYKVQNNAYKFSWALIPLSVPFLWIMFLHRRRHRAYRLYDHTVFVTYSIAFISLGAIVLALLRPLGLGDGLVGLAVLLIPPIHMYRQLRGAYSLSRKSALWRTVLLLIFSFIAGGLFMTLLLAVGALG